MAHFYLTIINLRVGQNQYIKTKVIYKILKTKFLLLLKGNNLKVCRSNKIYWRNNFIIHNQNNLK
jgi:hypothetical protein